MIKPFYAVFIFFTVTFLSQVGFSKVPVWIDTDPAVISGNEEIDDALALLQAFHSQELEIRGISVVYGNAPLSTALKMAKKITKLHAPYAIPVYRGASKKSQLGKATPGSKALAKALENEKLVILALGPVTNVATVIQAHPELTKNIHKVVAVAGRKVGQKFFTGTFNKTPHQDFNFEHDPEGFRVILDAKVPLVLAPFEISSQIWITTKDAFNLLQSPRYDWLEEPLTNWLHFWQNHFRVDGFNPFDSLAVAYVTHPHYMQCRKMPVSIHQDVDDRDPSNTKPYLYASWKYKTKNRALYCSRPHSRLHDVIVNRLIQN